jgi:hypothetical protein
MLVYLKVELYFSVKKYFFSILSYLVNRSKEGGKTTNNYVNLGLVKNTILSLRRTSEWYQL